MHGLYFTEEKEGSRYDWLDLTGAEETVALDVNHDVLDVGVPGPAVLLQDAHLTLRPQLTHTQLGDALLGIDLAKQDEWKST